MLTATAMCSRGQRTRAVPRPTPWALPALVWMPVFLLCFLYMVAAGTPVHDLFRVVTESRASPRCRHLEEGGGGVLSFSAQARVSFPLDFLDPLLRGGNRMGLVGWPDIFSPRLGDQ